MTELYDLEFIQDQVNKHIERDAVLQHQYAEFQKRLMEIESKLDATVLAELRTSRIEHTDFLMLQSFLAGIAYTKQFYKTKSLTKAIRTLTI